MGFRQGLRLGMLAAKGQVPAKVDPVGAVKQAADKDKAKSELLKGYEAMMAYTGEPNREV